ncbi:MAG: biopolymer transporter ExbD [Chlamydiales bacterium]|nr:biopolymer transporter ExbD [Chlamydiales bacterium]
MSFAPRDEILGQRSVNLAPMIDFLFLMLMFFASLAVTRITTRDTDIDLVELRAEQAQGAGNADTHTIHLSVTSDGNYKWVTEIRDYQMTNPEEIRDELSQQYTKGLLPTDKSKTRVLMKIDREAQWDPILRAIFAVREAGFEVHPVYQPDSI